MSVIEFKNATKNFGNKVAVNNVSFDLKEGEVVGLLGPNGAGKTTTIRLALGLLEPTNGSVKLFERAPDAEAKKHVGTVLERTGLYGDLTAYENLEFYAMIFGVTNAKEKIEKLLELVELKNERDSLVSTFSKGMKQKLAIARSLINDPELLIFDEVTSGLDPENRVKVRQLILELRKEKRTIFFSSHDLEEVQKIADRILLIRKGRLITDSSLSDMLSATTHIVLASEADLEKAQKFLQKNSFKYTLTGELEVRIDGDVDLLAPLAKDGIKVKEYYKGRSLEESYMRIVAEDERGA